MAVCDKDHNHSDFYNRDCTCCDSVCSDECKDLVVDCIELTLRLCLIRTPLVMLTGLCDLYCSRSLLYRLHGYAIRVRTGPERQLTRTDVCDSQDWML